jgi:membrane-bound inhibitor of C-type lysozyme
VATVRIDSSKLSATLVGIGTIQTNETPVKYNCTQGIKLSAQFIHGDQEAVKLTEGESTLTLPQVISADGGRYSDGKVTFWIKGNNATFDRNGKSYKCSVVK